MGGGGTAKSKPQSGQFSWDNGGASSSFKPADFNKQMGSDIQAAYLQPPKQFDKQLYTGIGDTTESGMQGILSAAQQGGAGIEAAQQFNTGLISDRTPSLTETTMMDTALGKNLGEGNPYLKGLLDKTADKTYADVMASFGGSGGVGSNLQTEQLTESLGDVRNKALYGDYQNSLNRQSQALSTIEGQRQQGLSNSMAAVSNAPSLYQAGLLPSKTELGVGQMQDADATAQRMSEYELFQRTNDPAFGHIAKYQGLLGGQAQNPQPEKKPGLFDWLGLGIGAAGLLA